TDSSSAEPDSLSISGTTAPAPQAATPAPRAAGDAPPAGAGASEPPDGQQPGRRPSDEPAERPPAGQPTGVPAGPATTPSEPSYETRSVTAADDAGPGPLLPLVGQLGAVAGRFGL
ncbi:hypothetical protein ACFVGN_33430, partial [Streptomyces sp. NPDC057757]